MPSRQVPNLPGQDRRIEALPALQRFVDRVEQKLGNDPVANFWQCEALFHELVRSAFPSDLINYELERVTSEPYYGPPSSNASQFTVYISDRFTLSIVRVSPHSPSTPNLQGLTRHATIAVLGGKPLHVEMFEAHHAYFDLFDRSERLKRSGPRIVQHHEFLNLRAGIDVPRISANDETLFISFISAPVQEIMWEYDAQTLEPVRAVSDNLATSRIEYALNVMARLGGVEHVPTLVQLFEHPAHFIRWAVVKSVLQIDFNKGLELLEVAKADRHPHVRNAALKTLQNLSAASAPGAAN